MIIAIAISSIFIIALAAWLLNKVLPFKICPVCAGVAGTWFWILAGLLIGWLEAESWQLIAAIAMGGSVVGIAYQLEKRLIKESAGPLFKLFFVPAGFFAVYSLITSSWLRILAAAVFMALIVLLFSKKSKSQDAERIKDLEKELEDCC